MKKSVFTAIVFMGISIIPFVHTQADEPDPLALPCTIGATAQKINPITKHMDSFVCDKCGSETCWIIQANK